MDLETLNPDSVEEVLLRNGAHSVTYSDAADAAVLEPAPGETPLWNDARISGLFSPDADFEALRDDLLAKLAIERLPAHEVTELEDRDWEREWLRDFGPMRFGRRLWICPGDTTVEDRDAVVVRLDPGLAFGTGTHPTTAMCLEWLDSLQPEGKTMLDFGCGSGVLAIAALKLGCRLAVGTDIDHQAIQASAANASRNGVAGQLVTTLRAQDIDATFEIVCANILAAPLIELAGTISSRVESGCLLALSGILSGQVEAVLEAYTPWFEFDEPVEREHGGQTWALLSGRKTRG
jgi:ribosomal protein L11 methyltransferase